MPCIFKSVKFDFQSRRTHSFLFLLLQWYIQILFLQWDFQPFSFNMFKKEDSSNHAHQTLFSLITSFFFIRKSNHHFLLFSKGAFFFLLYFTRLISIYYLLFIIIIIWFGGSHGWSGWCLPGDLLGSVPLVFWSMSSVIGLLFCLLVFWYSRVSPRLFFFSAECIHLMMRFIFEDLFYSAHFLQLQLQHF